MSNSLQMPCIINRTPFPFRSNFNKTEFVTLMNMTTDYQNCNVVRKKPEQGKVYYVRSERSTFGIFYDILKQLLLTNDIHTLRKMQFSN